MKHTQNKEETARGGILVYILIAIFMTGLLIAAMSQGAKKSSTTTHLDQMMLFLQNDIKTVQNTVSECAQTYPQSVDVDSNGVIDANDNPNPPFPLYSDLSDGAAGEDLTAIKCPGAPPAQQTIFNRNAGSGLKMLSDTAVYTTKYFTDGTEGIYIRITRATGEALWTEAISRFNAKASACAAANVTDGGACVNGCLYFWILRRATSVLGPEAGCP